MLENLRFTNFKTWPQVELKFGKITGLFGTNSSGKTSLIQFCLLLKQTKEATDRSVVLALNGPYVNLGVYHDMVHDHEDARQLDWELTFSRDKDLLLVDPSKKRTEAFAKGRQVKIESKIASRDGVLRAEFLRYALGKTNFSLSPKISGSAEFELVANNTDFKFLRTQGRPWQLPGPIKSYAFPDQARTYFQNASFLSDLEAALEGQLDSIFYLGPLREFPHRDYLWARSRPKAAWTTGPVDWSRVFRPPTPSTECW